ncbi:MAG TPA: hypothetical protein VLH15_11550 [Dehalococcoidales bacterium]|nr:hypothetical protein [Dehalococcoidales bacterium]
MPESKYGKCIKTGELIKEIPHYTGKSVLAHKGELETDCSIGYHCISKPITFDIPHSHNFAEMLCFFGGDARDVTDLGAEVEMTLGGEKHLITTAAVVSIPPKLKHCPIVIKNVRKPLVFLEISLTRIWKPGRRPRKKPAQ